MSVSHEGIYYSCTVIYLLPSDPGEPFEVVKAVQAFSTTEPGQLSVEAGDILFVLKKDVQAGWWLVKRERDNDEGLVPFALLQPVSPEDSPSKQGINLMSIMEKKT